MNISHEMYFEKLENKCRNEIFEISKELYEYNFRKVLYYGQINYSAMKSIYLVLCAPVRMLLLWVVVNYSICRKILENINRVKKLNQINFGEEEEIFSRNISCLISIEELLCVLRCEKF